ncbi:MAG: hypothetical protein HQK84_07080 [Nitrospinae bacterium]|nr:hypothetical protein [Nitrospinota bacterium]
MKKGLLTLSTLFLLNVGVAQSCEITIADLGSSDTAYVLQMNEKISFLEFTGAGTKEVSLKGEKILWIIKGKNQGEWALGAYSKNKKYVQGWIKETALKELPKLLLDCK